MTTERMFIGWLYLAMWWNKRELTQPCHLSLDSKPVLQQGEQVATAPAEFTVYFPPDADICEGDRLTITHSGSVSEYDVGTVHAYHINRICRCKRRGIV